MAAELLAVRPRAERLADRVPRLREVHAALWRATWPEPLALGEPSGLRSRLAASRAAARLVDALAAELASLPDTREERARWRSSVRERIQELGGRHLGWPAGYRRLLLGDAFYEASRAFAGAARRFDPGLPLDELWQALRNVWIGNSLQMLLDRPVALGEGLFAYSMLYPVTDNLLDDPRLPAEAKRAFNRRFGCRLAGERLQPESGPEAAAFRLVERIESEFARSRFPDVFDSLLAIHAGQIRSVAQQSECELGEEELLSTSCEKGGTSVLADLYLVAGEATPAEERFAFGYGVVLQLLDDLQDVERDLAAGHQTLFTRAARRGVLDEPTGRLTRMIERVLEGEGPFAGPRFADRRDLVRRNCLTLLVGAVAAQPDRFSRGFLHGVERRWPLGLRAQRRLSQRARRRFDRAAQAIRRRTGAASLLDWALRQKP